MTPEEKHYICRMCMGEFAVSSCPLQFVEVYDICYLECDVFDEFEREGDFADFE